MIATESLYDCKAELSSMAKKLSAKKPSQIHMWSAEERKGENNCMMIYNE